MKLNLIGGLLEIGKHALNIDGASLAKQVVTQATAEFSKPIVSHTFQEMHVAGRTELAGKLEKTAHALREGRCDDAAEVVADIIDDIKL